MASIVIPVFTPAFKSTLSSWLAWKTTTDSTAVGGTTRYPVGFTFSEVVRFLYGLKTFTISGTATGTVASLAFTLNISQTFTMGQFGAAGTGFTSESDLNTYSSTGAGSLLLNQVFDATVTPINMRTHQWQNFGNDSITDSPPDTVNGTASLSGLIHSGLYYPRIFTVLALNSPSTGIGMVIGGGMYPLVAGKTFGSGADGGNNSSLFTGTFLGKSVQYFICSSNALTVSASSFSVVAASYWPYDPGDGGGPIYNTTTGAQIRSPIPPL